MLHHVSLGVRDVVASAKFYDAVLRPLKLKRKMDFSPRAVAYGDGGMQSFWIQVPHDGKAPSVGNGVHIAFNAASKAQVNAFHAAALANGGTDDGAPGPRPEYTATYYGAFVRDLDGNKIEAMLIPALKQVAARPVRKAAKAKAKSAAKKKPVKKKKKARK